MEELKWRINGGLKWRNWCSIGVGGSDTSRGRWKILARENIEKLYGNFIGFNSAKKWRQKGGFKYLRCGESWRKYSPGFWQSQFPSKSSFYWATFKSQNVHLRRCTSNSNL
jgi:hypothetical protein